jgi:hypothetical protein
MFKVSSLVVVVLHFPHSLCSLLLHPIFTLIHTYIPICASVANESSLKKEKKQRKKKGMASKI